MHANINTLNVQHKVLHSQYISGAMLCRNLYEVVETANTAVADDVAMDQNPAYGVIEASSKL